VDLVILVLLLMVVLDMGLAEVLLEQTNQQVAVVLVEWCTLHVFNLRGF
jgi:hypothetical protein